jgi:hypothetical protein
MRTYGERREQIGRRHVFGAPADKDRDHYARRVMGVDAQPTGIMRLAVVLTLECGHTKEGFADGPRRRIPARIFCADCHRAEVEKMPKAPAAARYRKKRRESNPTHLQVVKRASGKV